MKTLNFYKLIILFFAVTIISSCVKDDDYNTPNLEIESPDLETEPISLNSMNNLYEQALFAEADDLGIDTGNDFAMDALRETFKLLIEEDTVVIYANGYVISNDEQGNFFEEIIIQDNFENPSIGVRVLIDVNPLFITYEFGRKVYLKLNGLGIGYENGVLTLGILDGNSIEKMSETSMINHVIRENEVMEIIAMPISISEFSSDKTNLYIRLDDVQFNRNDVLGDDPLTYANEPTDDFDGERILESCANGSTTIFSTSTFADFKAQNLPSQRGSIEGILTYNFFGEEFNVVINDLNGITFDNPDRCDPTEVDCGLADDTGANVLFSDFFESFSDGETISGNGWTNYSEAGTQEWEAFFSDDSSVSLGISAHIGSFLSGDDSTINWLITPVINFDTQDGETLEFKTSNSFSDDSTLELLFSSDWDGNPDNVASATWDLLSAAYIVDDEDYYVDWFESGTVDLSCISGSGYIAWKYVGSGVSEFDGTYELDEIVINSN